MTAIKLKSQGHKNCKVMRRSVIPKLVSPKIGSFPEKPATYVPPRQTVYVQFK